MRQRFLEIISCSKETKHDKSSKREIESCVSHHTALNKSGTMSDVEIYSFSKQGAGGNKTENQDSLSVMYNIARHTHYFGVYDGHGPNGKCVSNFVSKNISNNLGRDGSILDKALAMGSSNTFFTALFKSVENKLSHSSINTTNSGCCCISVLISGQRCYAANLGDSRAILCKQSESGAVNVVDLSRDHKPTREDEQARILKAGGLVEPIYYNGMPVGPLRVWNAAKDSGLAMTRTMGDAKGKQFGLISVPEIQEFVLGPDDKFIIAASDGLWDVMSSKEAASFVMNYISAGRARSEAPKALALEAKNRWSKLEEFQNNPYCDDITIVMSFLKYYPPETAPATLINLDDQHTVPSS